MDLRTGGARVEREALVYRQTCRPHRGVGDSVGRHRAGLRRFSAPKYSASPSARTIGAVRRCSELPELPSGSGKAVVERSRRSLRTSARRWWHFGTGALLGGLVFVWIYGGAYLEHRAFPEAQLVDAAVTGRSFNADSVTSPLKEFFAYQSLSSFAIALVIALLALAPGAGATRTIRIFALWGLAISIAVLLIPVRLSEFSLWMSVVAPLPGSRRFVIRRESSMCMSSRSCSARLSS